MNRFTRNRRTVVALTLGLTAVPTVALAATDAVPGDPFKLGQENRIVKAVDDAQRHRPEQRRRAEGAQGRRPERAAPVRS